jgi:mannose-6-phosphate isomerase-like protein (cupin superfamily)
VSLSHDSDEECVVVLKGSHEMTVGDETYLLNEGDSLLFESRTPHSNRNPGHSKAEVLWITTPPSY